MNCAGAFADRAVTVDPYIGRENRVLGFRAAFLRQLLRCGREFLAGAEKPGGADLQVLDIGVGEFRPLTLVAPEPFKPHQFEDFLPVEEVLRQLLVAALTAAFRRGERRRQLNEPGQGCHDHFLKKERGTIIRATWKKWQGRKR